jgi:hypothetical protein
MKTIVVHTPTRCRKPKMDIFDDHIDKVNNTRSKKYLPEDTNIHAMGMGGDGLIAYYKEKFFGIKRTQIVKPTSVKKVVKKKESVNKSDLKKAIKKQKQFLNGKVDKSFW